MNTDLKSQLSLLKTLQEIDVSIHRLDTELAAIAAKIDEAGAEFFAVKDLISTKEEQKGALEKQRKFEELELESQNSRIKDRESKLYAIKTNKEYQAAIKEIADAKQAIKDREEALMGLMERIENISEEIKQLFSGIADKEKAFKEKEQGLKGEAELFEAEKKGLLDKREQAMKDVDKAVLKKYQSVQRKWSDAMALAREGVCSGCNKRIPPQLYIELQKWAEIISCPNCHRLLFFEESLPEQGKE